jgi:hypothetical protein
MRTVAPRSQGQFLYPPASLSAASALALEGIDSDSPTTSQCRYTFKPTVTMRVIPFTVALQPSLGPVALKVVMRCPPCW